MRLLSFVILVLFSMQITGCSQVKKALPHQKTEEEILYAKTTKLMEEHVKLLRDAGRWPGEFEDGGPDPFSELGHYEWHSTKNGYFGAYSFSQEAFDQAMKSWYFHGQMAEGSDILVNVGRGAFDPSVVGSSSTAMTYCSLHGGTLHHCSEANFPGGKVVEFIDSTHVRLDKKSKWDSQMYGMAIHPAEYRNMCNCTNNFNPPWMGVPKSDDKPAKPCVQGGSLAPGESCSVSVNSIRD